MCINQEIVLTRVLTKQVVLYLLSVLVGVLYCTSGTRCLVGVEQLVIVIQKTKVDIFDGKDCTEGFGAQDVFGP